MCYENVPEESHKVSILTTATPFGNKDKFLTLTEELPFSITSCELPVIIIWVNTFALSPQVPKTTFLALHGLFEA